MTPNLIDHLLVILLALVFPVWDYFSIRKTARRIQQGETALRMKFYREVIAYEWVFVAVLLVAWFSFGRASAELGLVPEVTLLSMAGYALTLAICVLLVLHARAVLASAEQRAAFKKEFDWLGALMPHTRTERDGFDLVSITAGVCEEILFRGFVTAYFMTLLGAPFWAAAIGSSVVFGGVHLYQGPKGALKAGVLGLIMAAIYGMTGSLWAPMIVHAVMDIVAGRIAFGALGEDAPEDSAPRLAA